MLVRAGVKDGTVFDRVVYATTRDVGLPYLRFAARPAEEGPDASFRA